MALPPALLQDRNLAENGVLDNRFAGSEMPRQLGKVQAIRGAGRFPIK
jgi:hypothetical protein